MEYEDFEQDRASGEGMPEARIQSGDGFEKGYRIVREYLINSSDLLELEEYFNCRDHNELFRTLVHRNIDYLRQEYSFRSKVGGMINEARTYISDMHRGTSEGMSY